MATITVRIEDEVRDALHDLAQTDGLTISELIRRVLAEATQPIRPQTVAVGDNAPATLSVVERRMLALLHRILGRVLPADEDDPEWTDGSGDGTVKDQLELARVLEAGFTSEYSTEFISVEEELTPAQCGRVMDILDMFRVIDHSIEVLADEKDPIDAETRSDLTFRGFDHNRELEGKMSTYVQYLVLEAGRWTEQEELVKAGGNSHMPVLDRYVRMLAEYRRILASRSRPVLPRDYLLSKEDLASIAVETVHPSNRAR